MYVTFGDVVSIHISNKSLSTSPKNELILDDKTVAFFCIAPFGYFAEDSVMLGISINGMPFIAQQLTWSPGVGLSSQARNFDFRNVLCVDSRGFKCQPMDITTRDDVANKLVVLNGSSVVRNPLYNTRYTLASYDNHQVVLKDVIFVFQSSLDVSRRLSSNFSQVVMPTGDLESKCKRCNKCSLSNACSSTCSK